MVEQSDVGALAGEELSGVVFVGHYLQLQFAGITLSILTPARVRTASETAVFGEGPFANLLIGQIGKKVAEANVRPEEVLDLRFSDGSSIAVSLRLEDYVGAEAINLWLRNGDLVVL